jgi:hypothetical protein
MSRSLGRASHGLYSAHRVDFVPYERFLETCQLRWVQQAASAAPLLKESIRQASVQLTDFSSLPIYGVSLQGLHICAAVTACTAGQALPADISVV